MSDSIDADLLDYYQREQKSFWWAHYARLSDPIEDWADTRDVMVVDAAASSLACFAAARRMLAIFCA